MLRRVCGRTPAFARGLAKKAKRGGGKPKAPTDLPDVITLTGVKKTIPGGRVIFENANLRLLAGAKVGVLGANGAGKSSLLKLMAGTDADYDGRIWRREGVRIGMLEQEPQLDDDRSVLENITDGVSEQRDALREFDEVNERLSAVSDLGESEVDELLTRQATLMERIEQLDCWSINVEVQTAMGALNCPAGTALPATLSGGQRRRVALCRLLISRPELLLLDEPTNHLDASSVAWMESYLAAYRGSVVAVTHDRYFLDSVAQWILEIEDGEMLPYHGNYSGWLEHKAARLGQREKMQQARASRMKTELAWIRASQGNRGPSKARKRSYDKLVEEQQADRDANRVHTGAIAIAPSPRLGTLVLTAEGLGKSYGTSSLFSDLSFELPAGAVMGIIGPNGVGKTSLLRLITQEEAPDEGTLRLGDTVKVGYVNQSRGGLDPKKTVYEEISQGLDTIELGGREVNMRAYVAAFNLKGPMQEKLVGTLSGGERGRVHLAKTLREGCNLLLLDEPSNDLDVDTLRSLEEALQDYAGSAIVVSHDRWFLDRVCTHTLAFGEGAVEFFEGSVSQYYVWKERHGGRTAA